MNTVAEYVSPGHPDRLADAIAEGIVTEAVRRRPDALVAVEVAVHREVVFIDGRIAAGATRLDKESIVRDVYRAAGYGGPWIPDPDRLRIIGDLCEEELPALESDIRPFSDDQNIIIGYACANAATNHLPATHWIAGELGRRLFAVLQKDPALSATFGPDFKILVSIREANGEVVWERLVLSILHSPELPFEKQHRLLLPILLEILERLEAEGVTGVTSSFHHCKLVLNGAGEFSVGGPEGDNGLSGKKLVVDHYGPSVPIGGGAICGKDPHKIDKCGALRARQLAKQLVRSGADEATVTLGWAPGGDAPFLVRAVTSKGGVRLELPGDELPDSEWFSIARIVGDLELTRRDWRADVLNGYFANPAAPWERISCK